MTPTIDMGRQQCVEPRRARARWPRTLLRLVLIVLLVATAGIAIHDTMRYATAQRHLRDATYELAQWSAQRIDTQSRDEIANQLPPMAQPLGVVVYQYDQTQQKAQVWARYEVKDTIALGVIVNLIRGAGFSEARTMPWTIEDYREAGI